MDSINTTNADGHRYARSDCYRHAYSRSYSHTDHGSHCYSCACSDCYPRSQWRWWRGLRSSSSDADDGTGCGTILECHPGPRISPDSA